MDVSQCTLESERQTLAELSYFCGITGNRNDKDRGTKTELRNVMTVKKVVLGDHSVGPKGEYSKTRVSPNIYRP